MPPFSSRPTTRCSTGARAPAARRDRSSRRPDNPQIVYGVCKGEFSRLNLATGQEQQLLGLPAEPLRPCLDATSVPLPAHLAVRDLAPRPEGHLPHVAVRAPHPRRRPHLGRDQPGPHGQPARGHRASPASRSPATSPARKSTRRIYAFEESPLEKGVLWSGANDGPVHVSRDDGPNWTERDAEGPAGRRPRAADRSVAAPQGLGATSRTTGTCWATWRPTSIAPTTTARPGRA